MRSARECLDRADALSASADGCANLSLSLQLEDTAGAWRRLADYAQRQDALVLWLADPANAASSL